MGLKDVRRELKEIIRVLEGTDVSELDIETEDLKLTIKRGFAGTHDGMQVRALPAANQALPPDRTGAGAVEHGPKDAAPPAGVGVGVEAPQKDYLVITAPMVGTFYRAPSPEEPPYVEVGDVVEQGQTVCIIEAMKLMNEIQSEVRGRVVEIPVENGEPVEYGQVLFRLERL
ncbi:MAG TPA: acetyl-CoA carboxylase biotin carboxyl carrier protein [Firmicutes bacterium]|nr:acetyl-CoA carboxylase biotin carboxyl carrier protein [Bacillota bacterium]